MLETVRATRYVAPLREGGSLPAIVEADDSGLYVVKFRGAGQGPLALVAELVSGEIGRALDLKVPRLVLIDLDEAIGRNEPDPEIQDLLQASVGINVALDYLPGSFMFDLGARDKVGGPLASLIVWFDAFVTNVDRTAKNPNLLWWHRTLYLIDHGASLYFHHNWPEIASAALNPFRAIRQHVLLPEADALEEATREAHTRLSPELFSRILEEVPDCWLQETGLTTPAERRAAYVEYFSRRLTASEFFVEEALRARADIL